MFLAVRGFFLFFPAQIMVELTDLYSAKLSAGEAAVGGFEEGWWEDAQDESFSVGA